MAIRLSADRAGELDFRLRFESLLRYRVSTADRTLVGLGEAPVHAEPNYRGDIPDPIVYAEGRGTRFAVMARIVDTDGAVTETGGTLELSGGSHATVLVSIATSFNGFDHQPGLDGLDEVRIATEQLEQAATRSFDNLRERHSSDFARYYDRVAIDLGVDPRPEWPQTNACAATRTVRPTPTSKGSISSSGAIC